MAALHEIFPSAPIYTSIYDEKAMPGIFRQMDIRTSFMQKLPFIYKLYRYYFLLYPIAFEQFDLSGYDLILSSSSAFAKGIKKSNNQLHICYCYSPMRFVWRFDDYIKQDQFLQLIKNVLSFMLEPIKKWDLQTASNVDYFIAISSFIADRIQKTYQKESVIIYPPVETELFTPSNISGDYFLVISRLNAYKRIDLVIEAFNRLDLPLKIIGSGQDESRLKKMAKGNIQFLGKVDDSQLNKYLSECRALIFPGEEDFGIVPVEAMASGRPVIAYRGGGAEETVIEGKTGLFFDEQTPESLMQAVEQINFMNFNRDEIRKQAEAFSKRQFQQKIKEFIEKKYILWKN